VFSYTDWQGGMNASDAARPVELIWLDNAFDTQRRRGEDATARVEY
jgi:hypothetical protein